jgi:hypothetical protein
MRGRGISSLWVPRGTAPALTFETGKFRRAIPRKFTDNQRQRSIQAVTILWRWHEIGMTLGQAKSILFGGSLGDWGVQPRCDGVA